MLIGYDNIDMIKADLETFMDENDYKKTWCVILLGNRRKVEYNAKLSYRENTRDGWPTDFNKPCQIISEYLTEGEATVQADKLNSSLSKSDKLINRMKYVAIKMSLVKK
jgi:hypothetical protein